MEEELKGALFLQGQEIIRDFVKTLPDSPGVYRMQGEGGDLLYVGKAKSLKKRVVNYVHVEKLPQRLQVMVSLTRQMEFVVTQTEAEALLLEANLIKKLKPRYNILLRDDKSFPYIFLGCEHDFPMVEKYRGAKRKKGDYYGPFANAGAVNRTIAMLQRIFMLRNCSDSVFANRTRPCLQYHIKRCSAPCVALVSQEGYAEQVAQAKAFLEGDSRAVQEGFVAKMEDASVSMDYELAAGYRDRIRALNSIQSHQDINVDGVKDADVMAIAQKNGQSCVQVFFFRNGKNFGNHAYFPRHSEDETGDDIVLAVLGQFYQNKIPPREVILNVGVLDLTVIAQALSDRVEDYDAGAGGYKVKITSPKRGVRKRMLDFAQSNALAALERRLAHKATERVLLEKVAALFGMDEPPGRIEIYDNSHVSGTHMVGAMVVSGAGGFQKNAYRQFTIKAAAASDDYGMMREVLSRRFKRALDDEERDGDGESGSGRGENVRGGAWPDLVLIDGGLGQLNVALEVFEALGIANRFCVVAIAKGVDRHAGRETFFMDGRANFQLPVDDPVLYYLQTLRDEAHRFVIGTHRKKRAKESIRSELDSVPGIGPSRKKALLIYFGSAKAVSEAGIQDLSKVSGISKEIAQKIYDFFHA